MVTSKSAEVGDRILKVTFCFILMEEIWKDVKEFNGKYQVSNLGNVRRSRDNFVYKLQLCKNGYNYVNFSEKTKTIARKVSRLVALAFIPNPLNKPCVDHINTIRTDDRVENLRWVTRSENMKNPLTVEKVKKSRPKTAPWKEIPILQFTKHGEFVREWSSATAFGKTLGKDVSSNIIACIKGKQPSAYGYKWKYK